MIVLGIETSCDETAVAVLELGSEKNFPKVKLLSSLIASQDEVHIPYGGIVPELASRRHIEILEPMVKEGIKKAGISLKKIEGIAVTNAPGLVGSLLVGVSFAKSLAFGLKIPFVGVSHLEGHLNAPFLEQKKIPYPQIGLIVSGGHTALYFIKGFGSYEFLGGTRDDAAGEAFDKTAKLLGLGYPGGPIVDRLAKEGNPKMVKLPQPRLANYDFSFSGLKTAVRRMREREAGGEVKNLCAAFQETVVDHLIEKTVLAAKNRRCKNIIVTGGVACNSRLKEKMTETFAKEKKRVFFPSPKFCTDNATMIAYTGGRYLQQEKSSPLNLNAYANVDLKRVSGLS